MKWYRSLKGLGHKIDLKSSSKFDKLGLNKARGMFLCFSEAPSILYKQKRNSLQ
jgi:hypothetical protein